jgi:hypothetical protein
MYSLPPCRLYDRQLSNVDGRVVPVTWHGSQAWAPSETSDSGHVQRRGGGESKVIIILPSSIVVTSPLALRKHKEPAMRILWLSILLLSPVIRAAVLAIDYGAEFTKLSLVKPGVPFDVILDRDSKRKIQSVVGWKREDRVFGAEGKMSVRITS